MKSSLPKLAKDLAALVGIARKETDPTRIVAALVDARGPIETATRDRDAAEAAYRIGLFDVSESELEKRLAEKAAATIRLDRAEQLVTALTERLALAQETEAKAARKAIHNEAVAKSDAIRARMPEEYRHHALALRTLLRDLAETEVARARAEPLTSEFGAIEPSEYGMRKPIEMPDSDAEKLFVDNLLFSSGKKWNEQFDAWAGKTGFDTARMKREDDDGSHRMRRTRQLNATRMGFFQTDTSKFDDLATVL